MSTTVRPCSFLSVGGGTSCSPSPASTISHPRRAPSKSRAGILRSDGGSTEYTATCLTNKNLAYDLLTPEEPSRSFQRIFGAARSPDGPTAAPTT
jgi:hypothetical protein